MTNFLLSIAESAHDTLGGGSSVTHCQWRGAVVPSQRLDQGAFISELLQDSHLPKSAHGGAVGGDSGPFAEPYSLEMADGTLVSFLLVRGARNNIREADAARMAELVSTKVAAYMAGGNGSSYSFGLYFLHDPNTAAQVFEQKIAPMLATAKRLGGDAESYRRDLASRLASGAAEEMTLLTVRTHMKALRPDEMKRATEQYQDMIKKIMSTGKGRIGTPEVLVGVPFPRVPLDLVVYAVGEQVARKLVIGGQTYDPDAALALGMVDELAEPADLLGKAVDTAAHLATSVPADTFAHSKLQLRRHTIERIVNYEIDEDPKAQELWLKRIEDGWMAGYLNAATGKK